MTCLSFKKVPESLEKHLHLAAKNVDRIFISRRYHLRLSSMGFEEDKVREALLLAAALHDLGKGHVGFQTSPGGFRGHEIYSGYLASKMLKDLDGDLIRAISSAVVLHHHTKIGRIIREDFILHAECLREFMNVIRSLGLEDLLSDVITFAKKKEVLDWFDEIRDWMRRTNNLRLVYFTLYPLTIADNLAAMQTRGGRSVLGNDAYLSYWPLLKMKIPKGARNIKEP